MADENIDVRIQNKLKSGVDETLKLLSLWELPQLRDTFKEQEICARALKFLTETEIIALIPKIGPRTIFTRMLNEWRQQQLNESTSITNPQPHICVRPRPSIKPEIELHEQDSNWLNIEKDSCEKAIDWMQQNNEDPLHQNVAQASTSNSKKNNMTKVIEGEEIAENVLKDKEKYLCKVWNAERKKKKAFLCQPSIDLIIRKANENWLTGNRLVLECDGTDVDDDEILKIFLKEKCTFLILNPEELWTPTADNSRWSRVQPAPTVLDYEEEPFAGLESPRLTTEELLPYHAATQRVENEVVVIDDINDSSTMSSQSSVCSQTNSNPNAACNLFQNFEIPWAKFSSEIITSLNEGRKLGKLMKSFANVVVDELRECSHYITMSVYREVAQMAAKKFPDSFIERDGEGNVMSHSPISLIAAMRNRNNFLNSASKRKSTNSLDPIPNKKKSLNALARGCVNWQPQNETENINEMNFKKRYLISMHEKKQLQKIDEENVRKFMADCFSTQRIFFNDLQQTVKVKSIISHWPMIFQKDCLYDHFNKVMVLDIATFKKNFYSSILKMRTLFNIVHDKDEKAILKGICNYFKEDVNLLFKCYEFGTCVGDIKKYKTVSTPWISIIDTSPQKDSKSIAYIWLEDEITSKESDFDIVDLIVQLLCYYYIFNITYPKDISQTCEFLMRYFFKFYPSQLRGKKKHINNLRKINTLISKLDEEV